MAGKILVISPCKALSDMALAIGEDLGLDIDAYEYGFLLAEDKDARKVIAHEKYDVMIAHPSLAEFVRATFKKPTVDIQLSVAEYISAIHRAKRFGKPLALICHESILEELEKVIQLMDDIDYVTFSVTGLAGFQQFRLNLAKFKDYTLVGVGYSVRRIAEERGLDYVMIETQYKNLFKAIVSARRMIEATNDRKIENQRLKHIVDNAEGGIIAFDSAGTVRVCGRSVKQLIGISAEDIIGKSIADEGFPKAIKELYGGGHSAKNKLVSVDSVSYLVDMIHIKVEDVTRERILHFQKVSHVQQLENQTRMQIYSKGFVARRTFSDMIGVSESFTREIDKARRYSGTAPTILIEGATGTGKELFAQSIHNESPRRLEPFVAINCATLSETLLESELFGHVDGAFTGARRGGKAGLFELAHNGTIFLDEIGEISKNIQARLLRVLQEKEIMRVGGDRIIPVDVRIVAATNESLYQLVLRNKFREDLYFRINLLNLRLPSLRERVEDIPLLADHFFALCNAKYGAKMEPLSREFKERLCKYSWPGNVRELQNFIEKVCIAAPWRANAQTALLELLSEHVALHKKEGGSSDRETVTVPLDNMKNMQAAIIEKLMRRYKGDKKHIADVLGLSRVTIWKVLKKQNNEA